MTDWFAMARAHFSQTAPPPPARTDETPIPSVMAVPPPGVLENTQDVSAVLSVGVVALFETRDLAVKLMAAAMCACEIHGDGDQARADMRADIEATPPELRADLLQHFLQAYPRHGGQVDA